MPVGNVLDPIHDSLSVDVWDDPASAKPKLKEQHRKWIRTTVVGVLEKAGYTHVDTWLSLVLTGSLTTYQYDVGSDCDISLFIDAEHFPEWSRAEMIGVMITQVDGVKLPGTNFPMQCFVVPPDVKREDLYRPGLRSGYDIDADRWVQPPEPERSMDVEKALPGFYAYALEQADKMESLLKYEPEKAKLLWHQIHRRRQLDQRAGKGDYSESNIVYKFLANRGLFDKLSDLTGEYIAKTADRWDEGPRFTELKPGMSQYQVDEAAVERARLHLGLQMPVHVELVGGISGGYHGFRDGAHRIKAVGWLKPERGSQQIWHELQHAKQLENNPQHFWGEMENYRKIYNEGDEAYRVHPYEVEAEQVAEAHPFLLTKIASDQARVLYKKYTPTQFHGTPTDSPFIYVPEHDTVYLGTPDSYHWDLIQSSKALKALYPNKDEYWGFDPNSSDSAKGHIHGYLDHKRKKVYPYDKSTLPSEDKQRYIQRIADALEATPQNTQSWIF